jgi:hypothetical protein
MNSANFRKRPMLFSRHRRLDLLARNQAMWSNKKNPSDFSPTASEVNAYIDSIERELSRERARARSNTNRERVPSNESRCSTIYPLVFWIAVFAMCFAWFLHIIEAAFK